MVVSIISSIKTREMNLSDKDYPRYHQLVKTWSQFDSSCGVFWRRQCHPTPVLLPGKSHGGRSLVGCSPWGREESDMTEWLHLHFSLSCTGEGNGNPLQCSCLENPRNGGAWWAAVYGAAQSRTLKRLHSSSSRTKQRKYLEKDLSFLWTNNMEDIWEP